MRVSTALAIAMLFVGAAEAAPTRLTVCIDAIPDSAMVTLSTLEASAIYAAIGIRIQWRTTGSHCRADAIWISLLEHTPVEFRPGTMAYALPYEGTHIQVFYDRISVRPLGVRQHILGYVLAHEIGHVLQRIARHSAEGVMKASWSDEDYKLMLRSRLKFTPTDIELIHAGLEVRAAGTLLAKRN